MQRTHFGCKGLWLTSLNGGETSDMLLTWAWYTPLLMDGDAVSVSVCTSTQYLPNLLVCIILCTYIAQYIGGIYTYSVSGDALLAPRIIYLDSGDPVNLVMRVPKSPDEECLVISYYTWDRSESSLSSHSNSFTALWVVQLEDTLYLWYPQMCYIHRW